MKFSIPFLVLALGLTPQLQAQQTSSSSSTDSLTSKQYTNRLLLQGMIQAAPLVGIGLLQSLQNDQVRQLRYAHYPQFRHHYDDYLQFAPLVAQVGMRALGVQGASKSPWQTFTADALASVSMMAITSAIKYTARVRRPDGSSRNSFPSGHTAMAFTAATLLDQEYGRRYPWLSMAGYATASAVGVGRLLNNRHWIGDVVTGAGLGILSGHLGYWMADRLFGGSRRQLRDQTEYPASSLQLYVPITLTTTREMGDEGWSLRQRHIGVGVDYTPDGWPVYLRAEAQLSVIQALARQGGLASSEDYRALHLRLGAGRSWRLWQEFGLQTSLYTQLRQATGKHASVTASTPTILSGSQTALAFGLEVAPLWRLTNRIGLRLPLSVDYAPSAFLLERAGSPAQRLSRFHYTVGTALAVYL